MIESYGYRIIRFWNHDVIGNMDGACRDIECIEARQQ